MKTASLKKLFLINYAPPSSSVYKYASEIYECTSTFSEIINLQYSNRSKKWDKTAKGRTFKSPFKKVISANILLGRFLFREAKKYILNNSEKDRIIHYTHQTISPFYRDLNRSVVSIHDNPFTALEYGIYNTPKENITDQLSFRIYSHSIRQNLEKYKRFKYVISTSDYVRNYLIKYGFKNEITTIHPPVATHFTSIKDKVKLREELNLPIDKKLLLSVTTDQPRKNLNLIEKLLSQLDQSFQLVRVGKPILKSINYSGVDPSTINKIYNACDLLIMPSLEEGYGSPIPEAMTVGTPVVCSNIEVFHELCGDSAIYFDPYSVNSFADAVKTGINNAEIYRDKGMKRSLNFSYQRFCAEISKYYAERFFK